jgi:NCS2 family nucleobase:cation symporter-2/xanthine permease XanP
LDERIDVKTTLLVGIQHVFAMVVGIITPPLIVGQAMGMDATATAYLVSMALFTSGLTTLIQVKRIGPLGSGLLSVQGTSFNFIPVAIQCGVTGGMPLLLGMTIATAPTAMIFSRFIKHARRMFPPVVTGSVVVLIGLSLIKFGLIDFIGGFGSPTYGQPANIALGAFVMATITLVSQFGKGFLRNISIFVGIVSGYALAAVLGFIDFSPVGSAASFAVPVPLQHGFKFDIGLVVPWVVAYLITAMESVGDLTATSGASREPTAGPVFEKRLEGGVLADGLSCSIAALFNSLPVSTFAQNNGVIKLTGVASRRAGIAVACYLMVLGLFPKLGALICVMPKPVLGGASTLLFGMVAVGGLRIISKDGWTTRNELILALSLGLGLGVTMVPDAFLKVAGEGSLKLILESGLAVGSIVAVVLNFLLPPSKPGEVIDSGH